MSLQRAINLTPKLAKVGIDTVFVPAIQDKYVVHHDNLGGVGYLYLKDTASIGDALVISFAPDAAEGRAWSCSS